MTKSSGTVLLLGQVNYAKKEWEALAKQVPTVQVNGGTRQQFLADLKSGKYDGVVAIYRTYESAEFTGRFDTELINALPSSVKFISHNGAGYDQIDIPPCTKRGIQVSHTPKAVDDATADVAMSLMLGALRRNWYLTKNVREGRWRTGMQFGHDPEGKTLGIIGLGGIGGAVAKRAIAFDLKVQYHNRIPSDAAHNPTNAKFVPDFDEFLATSDIISLHVPLNPSTRHYLSTEQFAKMKDNVVIINTSRGPVVDEAALVAALESGKVFAAGLDVFENEPKIHPGLLKNDNVVLYPHIGTLTWETQYKMEALVVANVESAINNKTLITRVPDQADDKF